MNLELTNSADYLYARLSGEFTLPEAERTFLQIVDAVDREGAGKILVDGRTVTGQPTTVERFFYGEFVARAVVDMCLDRSRKTPVFSYVLTDPVIDRARLGETVALNRGMRIKTFEDLNAAIEWLERQ